VKTIKAGDVRAGMVCEDSHGAWRPVVSSETVKRFDLSFELQEIRFDNGAKILVRPTTRLAIRS